MTFDASSIKEVFPSRKAGIVAMTALATAIASFSPAQGQVAVNLEGIQSPQEVATQIERETRDFRALAEREVEMNRSATRNLTFDLMAAQRDVREFSNRQFMNAVNQAFFSPGVGTCFRAQTEGLRSGMGSEARALSQADRGIVERANVQIVARIRLPNGSLLLGSEVIGTGTIIQSRDGGPNRILTAEHVVNPSLVTPQIDMGQLRWVLEAWTTSAAGERVRLGTLDVIRLGGAKVNEQGSANFIDHDWAVLRLNPENSRAAAWLRDNALPLATDLPNRSFAAEMGTRYNTGTRGGDIGGDLPPPSSIPGGKPTPGLNTGQSGSAFIMADVHGRPAVMGLVSSGGVLYDAINKLHRFTTEVPILSQIGAIGSGRPHVLPVPRVNTAGIQHLPVEAIQALGWREGIDTIITPNSRVHLGAQGFVAGYQNGHCVVSAGVTFDSESRNTPGFTPGQRRAIDTTAPFHLGGATWLPDGRGGFRGRIDANGFVSFTPGQRPQSGPDTSVLAEFTRPGTEIVSAGLFAHRSGEIARLQAIAERLESEFVRSNADLARSQRPDTYFVSSRRRGGNSPSLPAMGR